MPQRWYPTKVDRWLGAILALTPVVCAAATVSVAMSGEPLWVALLGDAVLVALFGGLVFPMRYAVTEADVVVRHGLVRQRIPLADIVEVVRTRNPLSSPALSLDRLQIRFGEGFFKSAMISPREREEFLADLAARSGLRRDGDRLFRC